jgi:hypothetical protein
MEPVDAITASCAFSRESRPIQPSDLNITQKRCLKPVAASKLERGTSGRDIATSLGKRSPVLLIPPV